MALTEKQIRDAKPGPKPFIVWDGQVSGLGVKVFPSGSKSFVLSYRAGGHKRLATIGRCSELSLKAARERAGQELIRIRDGAADPLERRRAAREAPTVAELCEQFLSVYAPGRIERGRMAPRTLEDYGQQIRRYLLPGLGHVRVASVKRADAERAVTGLKPVMRNRVLALINRLMTYAEFLEWRPQHTKSDTGDRAH